MNEKRTIIKIETYLPSEAIVITGRDAGIAVRKKIKLASREDDGELFSIVIDKRYVSFKSSYFLGMFSESVKKFGDRERFLNVYEFNCDEIIMKNIDRNIKEALKENNALS